MIEPITAAIALLSIGYNAISTIYGVVSDGVPGEVAGGETHNFVRENFDQLRENLNRHLPYLNHDLQRALRLAYLQATLQVCAIRLQEHGLDEAKLKTFLRRRFPTWLTRKEPLGIFAQGEVEWIDKVCVWVEQEIRKLKSEQIPPLTVDEKALGLLMQPTDAPIAQTKSLRGQLIEKVIDELKAEHGKLPDDFYSLMTKGWTQVDKGVDLKQDWFDLFCLSFQHEAKKKNDIRIDFQNKILAGLTFQNSAMTFNQVTDALAQSNEQLAKKLDEATKLIQGKINAGFENLNERFDELAPVLALADDIPAEFDSLADLIRAEHKETRAHFDKRFDQFEAKLEGRILLANEPQPFISSLPDAKGLEGREAECEIILRAMSADVARVMAFAAPGGFGKTALLAKLAGKISVDGKSFAQQVALQNAETIEPQVSAWLHVDFRNPVTIGTLFESAGNLVGQSNAFRDIYNNAKKNLSEKLQTIFHHLSSDTKKRVWFVFDNFEPLLDGNGNIKDAEWREFFNQIYFGNHSVRVLIASRKVPNVPERFESQFLKLDEVIKLLFAGLPEDDCVSLLRGRKAHRGLRGDDAAIDAKLKEFAKKVHLIPMALVSVAGYLNKKKTKTLDDIKDDVFTDFVKARLNKESEEYLERGLMTLHSEQLKAQPANAVLVLRLLAFFNRHVPLGALTHLLPEGELEDVLTQLEDTDYLITRRESANQYVRYVNDPLEINFYGLHPVICENVFFNEQPDKETLYETTADKCWGRAFAADKLNRFAFAIELYDCAEKLYEHLTKELNRKDLLNSYTAMLMNKGVALAGLGSLNEAIKNYDLAINILKPLVEDEGRKELANDLAMAYGNKALALEQQKDWDAALVCYENAVEIRTVCVNERGMFWIMPDLLQFLRYRLMTLLDLNRWQTAAQDVSRFLELYTPFIERPDIHDGLKNVQQKSLAR